MPSTDAFKVIVEDEVTVLKLMPGYDFKVVVEDETTVVKATAGDKVVAEDEITVVQFQTGERGKPGPAGTAFAWLAVSSAISMAVDTGYIPTSDSARVVLTLPDAVVGSTVKVAGAGLAGWKIVGAPVHFGNVSTDGYLQSTDSGDCVELVCLGAAWRVTSSIGTIEYED